MTEPWTELGYPPSVWTDNLNLFTENKNSDGNCHPFFAYFAAVEGSMHSIGARLFFLCYVHQRMAAQQKVTPEQGIKLTQHKRI